MLAYLIDAETPGRLVRRDAPEPSPLPSETVVRVRATSLNRGEVRMAIESHAYAHAYNPGWDAAGVVERASADGKGPVAGTRVVGFVRRGAWAELAAVPNEYLAPIPDDVSFAQASTLPVAGLTTLHVLYKGGSLLGKKVLVTGATGGVGDFAIQLARHSGAIVTAHVRRESQREFVVSTGAHHAAVGEKLAPAAHSFGPFDLIVESVGGEVLGDALGLLAERGVCVLFGTSGGKDVTFDAQKFYAIGGASLYGLIMGDELKWIETGTLGLTKLGHLVSRGSLKPQIGVEDDWANLPQVAADLLNRKFLGKGVLHIG